MGARVTIAMSVFNQLALTRACLESLRATTEPFRLVVIDNGSTDDTARVFERFEYPYPLRFERNGENRPVIATLNRAWRLAETDYVCVLHNDTELVEPEWLARLVAALAEPGAGLAGLYGVKRLRRSGRYVGRTIVHSLAEGPTVRPPWEEVAVVDSVCMCLPRALLEEVGGFDEGYGFYHGLDRDLSFAVRERGRRCLVVRAPFVHHGGANEQVMLMVEQIGTPAKAEAWIRKALADKVRVMGFGHRVYRVADPRARHLRRLATELGQKAGNTSYVEILDTVARVVTEGKHIFPNVDLYSGAAYKSMGIPTDQFTPIFALSRVAGWAAHVMEQHANNRLIRPRAQYTGPTHVTYVPIDRR